VPVSLTPRERAHLKARAHALEPSVQVGQAGLTDALVIEVERALKARQLIKVKILGDDREARRAVSDELCKRVDAALVQSVGKVVVLWRPKPEEEEADANKAGPVKTTRETSRGARRGSRRS
jgi:RNA-binding protein